MKATHLNLEFTMSADVARAVTFELNVFLLLARGDFKLAFVRVSDSVTAAHPSVQRRATRWAHALGLVLK